MSHDQRNLLVVVEFVAHVAAVFEQAKTEKPNNVLKRNAYMSEIKSYQNNSDQLQCQCLQAFIEPYVCQHMCYNTRKRGLPADNAEVVHPARLFAPEHGCIYIRMIRLSMRTVSNTSCCTIQKKKKENNIYYSSIFKILHFAMHNLDRFACT